MATSRKQRRFTDKQRLDWLEKAAVARLIAWGGKENLWEKWPGLPPDKFFSRHSIQVGEESICSEAEARDAKATSLREALDAQMRSAK